jgi:UDP-3-O-[3-hydroxymyristoyl] glucosamine N-acyltransferase
MTVARSDRQMTIAELASLLGAELIGDGTATISGVGAIESSTADQVTFLESPRHAVGLAKSAAAAVIVSKPLSELSKPQLVVKDVDKALILALQTFAPVLASPVPGVHPTALVDASATLGKGVSIGPYASIAEGAKLGDNTVIASGVSVGQNTVIGNSCRLDAHVVVYHNCVIGNNVWIQANSTIGSTGFGYKFIDGRHALIPHNGGVVIEDFVDIGAGCTVDRAKFGNTVIGAGSKIDNQVQIAHNVVLGKCCLLAAQVGVAGSTRLGNGVVVGGQSGFKDHITVGDGAMVAARSGLMGDMPAKQVWAGNPAVEIRELMRSLALTGKLPKMADQLKEMMKRIEVLESAKNDSK